MTSKLSLHFQLSTNWMSEFARISGVQYIKWMDPCGPNPFPANCKVIGRLTVPDEGRYWRLGITGAREYFRDMFPRYMQAPWVHAWEALNEPPCEDPRDRKLLSQFFAVWTQMMHETNHKVVIGNFSVCHPPLESEALEVWRWCFKIVDYLGLHQYSAENAWDNAEGTSLRHRPLVAALKDKGIRVPPILLGEAVIDRGVIGRTGGWARKLSVDEYMGQLRWFDAELQKDPEVLAAFLFTAGANAEWRRKDFDHSRRTSMRIAEYIRSTQ